MADAQIACQLGCEATEEDPRKTFDELCRLYRSVMRDAIEARMPEELKVRVDPSDIVQEAFLEAYARLSDYLKRKPMPMPAWLMETAIQQLRFAIRHHVLTAKRSLRKQISFQESNVQEDVEQDRLSKDSPQERVIRKDSVEIAWQFIGLLPENDRELLLLRYSRGLSNAEVACILGESETVIRKRHYRAMVRLQHLMLDRPRISGDRIQ
jgi:RNA polymerase sigma-70 factor, ECF subfamily